MTKLITLLSLIILSLTAIAEQEKVSYKHHFIAVDNHRNQLIEINQINGTYRVAKMPAQPRDINKLPNGQLIVSLHNGFLVFDHMNWQTIRRVIIHNGIESAFPLNDKEVLLTINEPKSGLLKVDYQGNIITRYNIPDIEYLRLARLGEGNHYLFTSINPFRALKYEYNSGQLTEVPLKGKGYKLSQIKERLYATTGELKTLDVFDTSGTLLYRYGGVKEHPDRGLRWFSGFSVQDDNSVIIANWLGHEQHGQGPHLVQFDKNNQLVWQWEDYQLADQITNFLILKSQITQ